MHALDPSSAHPENVVDTVLCHTGPVKSMSVRGAALVPGSARRLAVHALVGKELSPGTVQTRTPSCARPRPPLLTGPSRTRSLRAP